MKKILSVALSTAMAFSMFASVAFGETATTPQAKFDALAAKGILNGYPDGQAHLEKDLTRAEFAKIVTKLFDLTEVTGKLSYKDKGYTATNWAVPYIEAVTAANLMQGKDTVKGIFDYNGKVTVEEVAAVLFRALKLETPATTDNSASAWAKGYAQAVINAGLVAQGTNFKANATRSLVVEAAYAVDNLTAIPSVTAAEALSPTSVLVTFSDKTTTTVTLTTALVEGVETTINFKNNGHDYTAKVTLAAPKVVSVTAPNSKQLVVKFNRPVDSATISETVANVTTVKDGVVAVTYLNGANTVNVNGANIVLGSDNTEAVITFAGSEFLKGSYAVALTDAIKTTAGEKVTAYTQVLSVSDTTAPSVVSVSAVARTTTNRVVLKLSEPVVPNSTRVYVNGTAYVPTTGNSLDELVVTSGTLEAGKTYDVSVLNLADYAGNVISPNPTKTTVTVVSDVASPTVSSLTVTGERTLKLVFSKDMDQNTVNANNIKLVNADGTFAPLSVTKVDAKTYTLTVQAAITTATTTGTVSVNTSVRDFLGNPFAAAFTQAVSFAKDTVAPTVTSVSYGSNGLVIKFSENVNVPNAKQFTIINESNGTVAQTVTATAGTYGIKDDTVTFPNITLASGTYTLRLPAGFVNDLASAPNSLAASTTSFTYTATTTSDSERPKVASVTPVSAPAGSTDQTFSVVFTDNSGLDLASLRDVNNYTLGGTALPAGTFITLSGFVGSNSAAPLQATVNISVPNTGVAASGAKELLVSGVKDTAGNVIQPAFNSITGFVDKVSPVLTAAAVSSDLSSNLVLTFSEKVLVSSVQAGDFVFTVNGVEIPSGVAVSIQPIAADNGFATKFTVSIPVLSGTYNGAAVLYVEKDGVNGPSSYNEIIAYTTDTAAILNLGATYVTNLSVKVADNATITDSSTANNNVTTGTVITVK